MSTKNQNPFHQWVRLEQPRLGTRVVYANDEFFGAKERLIDAPDPVFIDDKFDDNGKWMDGWESRRKRGPGHDHCIIRLGIPGVVRGFDIDTSHFTGNFPPAASIDACISDDDIPEDAKWQALTGEVPLSGNSHEYVAVDNESAFTHIRLNILPDGGVARLRIFGEVEPDFSKFNVSERIDLFALENGGRAILCNDEHFGSMHNLNIAERGINMGDGWETARRRVPGNDWVILSLGHLGKVEEVEVDTAYFKGNYPDRVLLQAANAPGVAIGDLEGLSRDWPVLLPEQKLSADKRHLFADAIQDIGAVTHLRMSIFPDGGVSRLRVNGALADES
jgi:allantoicase